jgi:hypothetical protein
VLQGVTVELPSCDFAIEIPEDHVRKFNRQTISTMY